MSTVNVILRNMKMEKSKADFQFILSLIYQPPLVILVDVIPNGNETK